MGDPALGPVVCPDPVDLPGPAGLDNGKPKSYERFWALSRVEPIVPISEWDDVRTGNCGFVID